MGREAGLPSGEAEGFGVLAATGSGGVPPHRGSCSAQLGGSRRLVASVFVLPPICVVGREGLFSVLQQHPCITKKITRLPVRTPDGSRLSSSKERDEVPLEEKHRTLPVRKPLGLHPSPSKKSSECYPFWASLVSLRARRQVSLLRSMCLAMRAVNFSRSLASR